MIAALTYSNLSLLLLFFFWWWWRIDILKSRHSVKTTYFLDIDIEMLILVIKTVDKLHVSIKTIVFQSKCLSILTSVLVQLWSFGYS